LEVRGIKAIAGIFDPTDYRALESENADRDTFLPFQLATMLDGVAENSANLKRRRARFRYTPKF
jgi:hypothetical protein